MTPARVRQLAWAVAGLVLLGLLTPMLRPDVLLMERPLTEDAFYALAVSRNLALGNGTTIDGEHLTNGFQPLFTLLCTLPYLLLDGRLAPLRGVLALHWIVHLGTVVTVADVARRIAPPTLAPAATAFAALLWAASGTLYFHHHNGLETGLLLLLQAQVLRAYVVGWPTSLVGSAATGGLLGLLVLARIDGALLVAGLCLATLGDGRGTVRDRLARAVVMGAVSVGVSSPWWVYNQLTFGSVMPTSGSAQQAWGVEVHRVRAGIGALATNGVPALDLPGSGGTFSGTAWASLRVVAAAGLGLAAWRAPREAPGVSTTWGRGFALATAGWLVYYVFGSYAVWHYPRYFAPLALPAVLGVSVWLAGRTPPVQLVAPLAATIPLLALGDLQTTRDWSRSPFYDHQVPLVAEHVPRDARVASWQTGTLGYLRDGVVNLDGKVNPEALEAKGDMAPYLAAEGIDWLCDWPANVAIGLGLAHDGDPTTVGWAPVASDGGFTVYRRVAEEQESSEARR